MGRKKNICGAKTRAGTPCQQKAGWGTNHVGEGRCKLHGGASTGPRDRKRASEKKKKNKNAEKHGLFSKHLPEETNSIIEEIENKNPIDILWENITIQYAAIIRAQKIMYVKDKNDKTKELTKIVETDGTEISEFEIQQAWDKQANFLQAQSRAMSALRGMIKQYDDLCRSELATEEQKARIEKLKADTNRIIGIEEEIEDLETVYKEIYGDTDDSS